MTKHTTGFMPEQNSRQCMVCLQPIEDVRKAKAVGLGAGTTALVHGSCYKSLQEVAGYVLGEDMSGITNDDWQGRLDQIGSGNVWPSGTGMNGGESGAGRETLNSKPCVCGDGMVHDGSSIQIGAFEYACHSKCRQRVLEMIAGALDVGNLQDAHYESIIRNLGA